VEHLRHFGLSQDPFRNEPRLRDFIETASNGRALKRLDRALRQAKGLAVLVGEVGSGKTMVLRRLLERLEEEIFEASMLVMFNGAGESSWIIARFAKQLGVEAPAPEREGLLAQIYDCLAIVREDGRHAVLIVDDADELTSPRARTEIAALLKLEYEDRRLLSLIVAGPPSLEAAIAQDPALAHRTDVKVRLEPLDAEGGAAYLARRIEQAGGDPAIFEPDATQALQKLGRGLPGLMNTLADNALFEAFLCGRKRISSTDVERAHGDLGWGITATPASVHDIPTVHTVLETDEAPADDAELEVLEPLDDSLGGLDSELEAVFDDAVAVPCDGPPKDEASDGDDLIVELLDD
jgi:type II secretory pathway predicted ATPase ExeA